MRIIAITRESPMSGSRIMRILKSRRSQFHGETCDRVCIPIRTSFSNLIYAIIFKINDNMEKLLKLEGDINIFFL